MERRTRAPHLASAYPAIGLASPQDLPALHEQVMCYVDDVDVHYGRSFEAGATTVGEPEDQPHGDRSYRTLDPEGPAKVTGRIPEPNDRRPGGVRV